MPERNSRSNHFRILFLLVLLVFATEHEAKAYTDPGSGMLIWQMILAAIAGAAFYFRRFTSWVRNRRIPRK